MNIEHLKTFREIARLGSFSKVARELGISQPAVSFQVQRLEQELGIRLIDRNQKTITLTKAGKRLLNFAEAVEEERDKLGQDLEQMREDISGDLLIGASTIPGEYLLPKMLAVFKQRHPAVKIQMDISDSVTVINRVRDNTYELGFCGIAPEGKDLASFKIAGDEIAAIVATEHPFASRDEVSAEELEGEALIFREATSGTQRSLEGLLGRGGVDIKKWTPQLVLGSTQSVINAVAAGAGIGFVSSLAIKGSGVKPVRIRDLRLARDFYCVYRQERVVSRLLDTFIDFMQTYEKGN
ncbi:MAG: LysR family transcriptional regulator [Dehalococcoidales bacterium]|nr:LysR family transcriptional regulator [Dehalococcoidales bacterium]